MSVYIQSIGTALPDFGASQQTIADFMVRHLRLSPGEERRLRILYRASGIQQRYSVLEDFGTNLSDKSFFKEDEAFPSIKTRMEAYQNHALNLAEKAVRNTVDDSMLSCITHLITVSCTGMYAPGLDIGLIQRLGIRTNVERTAVNFMGCYAAFNGLKLANQIVQTNQQANVLMVCVELCSLHLQKKKNEENLLANAIFGDGGAGVHISSTPGKRALLVENFYSDLALEGEQEMTWNIGDYGFEMTLSGKVPDVIESGISQLTDRLLETIDLKISDIDFFAIHPGGKRILDVIEEKLQLRKEKNYHARNVLKNFGNMSSPTVLFVIKSILSDISPVDNNKYLLSFAFGPGLTMESMVLRVHIDAENQISGAGNHR